MAKTVQYSDGDDGKGGRFGLWAKVAAGVVILGCVAALAFGGVHLSTQGQQQQQAAPPAPTLPAGTDDLATTACIGTLGPFACQAGQALAGTDDFAPGACVGVVGPFACAQGPSTAGTDDLATNGCVGTAGPFACPSGPPPGPANFRGEDY